MNRKFIMTKGQQKQRGAILVTSLLLLVILTVLGVAMMRMTNMQERMSGNTRDVNLSLQGAEAALRAGEARLGPLVLFERPDHKAEANCFICEPSFLPVAIYDPTQFDWKTQAHEYGVEGTKDITELADDPRYVISELAFVKDSEGGGQDPLQGRVFYQVTSFSSGASGLTNTVLQSTFPRRF